MTPGELHIVERCPGWQRVLGVVLAVVTVAEAALVLTRPASPGLLASLLFAVVATGAAAYGLIRSAIMIRFSATTGLCVRFRPVYARRLTIEEIQSVSVVEHLSPARTLGTGLRRLPGGRFALLFHSGPAVEITPRAGRSVVVQTDRAAEIVRAIQCALPGP